MSFYQLDALMQSTAHLVKTPPAMQGPRFNYWVRKIRWRRNRLPTPVFLGFPCGSAGNESACNAGGPGLTPGLGRSPGEGKSYLLSILTWRIPWTIQSIVSQRVRHNWATFTYVINTWKPKWNGDYPPPFLTFFLQENQLVESLASSRVWVRSTGFHGWREDPTLQYQLVRVGGQLQPSNPKITASLLFSDTQQPKDSLRAWSSLAP